MTTFSHDNFNCLIIQAEDVLYSANSFSPKWKLSPIQNKLALKDIIEVETQIAEITPVAELEEFLTVDELNNLAPSVSCGTSKCVYSQ